MHGSVVIFCLYEDYEKIEFCVISLDRVCISRASGGGGAGARSLSCCLEGTLEKSCLTKLLT